MWLTLASWFIGGKSPIDALQEIYVKHKDSIHAHERLAAEEAKSKRDALLAEQQAAVIIRRETAGFWEMRVLTAATLFFFVTHLGAVWLDTMWTSVRFDIPKLPTPIDEWEGTILLSLFGIAAAQRSVMSIAAAIAVRKR